MADEGTLAPDPQRLARARRAGLRPTSPWLWPAAGCLALGLALHVSGDEWAAAWRDAWRATLATETTGELWAALRGGLFRVLAWAGALALGLAALTGALGGVDRRARERLRVGSLRSPIRGLLALAVPALAVWLVIGACAGAARAVDASPTGLQGLWSAWLQKLLFGTGALLLVAGWIDRALARRRLWRALHRTVAEARAERRDA